MQCSCGNPCRRSQFPCINSHEAITWGPDFMPNFDLSEFKRLLTATRERDAEQAKLHRPTDITPAQAARKNNRRALEQLLGPALEKTGVAISKVNEILAQDQT